MNDVPHASPPRSVEWSDFDALGIDPPAQQPAPPTRRTSGRRARATTKRAPRPTVVGVAGELLLTAGVIVLLFVGWKYWLNDLIVGDEQNSAGVELQQQFAQQATGAEPPAADQPPAEVRITDPAQIPVAAAPTDINERFAVLYVPAWGADYSRPIAEGTDYYDVLDENIGHYAQSAMPGAVGNFAIAGHRLAYGASMQHIHELQIGDEIIIETTDGWYTYVYRSGEYVAPTQVDVLNSVPRVPEQLGSDRLLTLMSCNPFWSTAERIIAYAIFDHFTPRSAGAPASIAATVNAGN